MNKMIFKLRNTGLTALGLVLLAGCHGKANKTPSAMDFPPPDEVRSINRFNDAQSAAGARNDATLYPAHFNGAALSSLGAHKLDDMIADDDACEPMTVYVNLDENDARTEKRRSAVVAYLKDSGLRDEQIKLADGRNPDVHSPSSLGASKLYKIEDGKLADNAQPAGEDGAGTAAPAANSSAGAK
ncbi:MAG: hypothetical protein IT447_13870 [Phycisphaerales bacterium]|nr:hypothetical protein [Phycisphaerales bacterium]